MMFPVTVKLTLAGKTLPWGFHDKGSGCASFFALHWLARLRRFSTEPARRSDANGSNRTMIVVFALDYSEASFLFSNRGWRKSGWRMARDARREDGLENEAANRPPAIPRFAPE
jgi:hypothetical protein